MSYLSVVFEKLAKFFRGLLFGTPGSYQVVQDALLSPTNWATDAFMQYYALALLTT